MREKQEARRKQGPKEEELKRGKVGGNERLAKDRKTRRSNRRLGKRKS